MPTEAELGKDFAYEVPSNPFEPEADVWATAVRRDRVQVGDRLALSTTDVSPDGERTIHDSGVVWEVTAIEPTDRDGQTFHPRRKLAPDAIWSGRLIVRVAE